MKRSVRLSSLALLLAAPAVVLSCSSSTETSDNDEPEGGSGGDSGGSAGGKGGSGGAGKGGSGGSGSGTAGKGGTTANGGSGGTTSGGANGTAGSGGSGGSGNTAGTGGGDMGGSGTGGTAPVDFCSFERDRCYPGAAGPAKRTTPKANRPAVCTLDRALLKDGDLGQGPGSVMEPLNGLTSAGGKYQELDAGAGDSALFKKIYVPKAMDNAANGGLGVLFVLGGDGNGGLESNRNFTGYTNRSFTLEGLTDKLAQNGDIPPLLVVWPTEHGSTIECRDTRQAIDNWRTFVLPRLKQLFPKLSDKPEMRAVIGQSTEGAKAFDFAWRAPDVVAKVFSGSGSFVCFMRLGMTAFQDPTQLVLCPKQPPNAQMPALCCPVTSKDQTPLPGCDNFGYSKLVRSCAAKNLRVSLSVGKDDITPQGVPGQDDTSSCQANWLATNTDFAAALKEKGVEYQYVITPGGHGPDSWVAYAGDRFRWLFRDVMCFD